MIDKDRFEQYINTLWHNHSSGKDKDLIIVSLGLAGETGEVLEILKKRIRDDKFSLPDLELELGDVLHYLIRIANHHGLTLESIMQAHAEKMGKKYGLLYNPAS